MKLRSILIALMAGMLWLPASSFAQDTPSNVTVHVVQRGETLFRISLNYGLTVNEIAAFNGIVDPTNILVGQRLLIPVSGNASQTTPPTHVVQAGETLKSIATVYGLTVDELVVRNNLVNANVIYTGQVLNIRESLEPTPTIHQPVEPIESPSLVYTVQVGDTLFRIATRYGMTVNALTAVNNILDPTVIYTGQQIIIPGLEDPQLALDLPAAVSSLDIAPLIFVEGETGRFRITTTSSVSIVGSFLERTLFDAAEQDDTLHTILVGVPMFTETGIYPLSLILTDRGGVQTPLNLNVQILSGSYGREAITLRANQADLLDPNVEGAEQSILQRVMGSFTANRYFDGPMGLPAAASVISPFGRKRSYNGGPFDRFHAGTDFAGAPGTSVLASASGYVVLADTLNVRGLATIIDHGWGVYTGYWHQSQLFVKVGDFVTSGQAIGTIGSTGRVTGPHLHWELWVNGVAVNPMQWAQESFS
jgi:murein DD-endopeptidase MepM/ murein hydrolase activator NlpD